MHSDRNFKIWATSCVIFTIISIVASFAVVGAFAPVDFSVIFDMFAPTPLMAAGELSLGLLVRGYCLGFFVYESGHWSLTS